MRSRKSCSYCVRAVGNANTHSTVWCALHFRVQTATVCTNILLTVRYQLCPSTILRATDERQQVGKQSLLTENTRRNRYLAYSSNSIKKKCKAEHIAPKARVLLHYSNLGTQHASALLRIMDHRNGITHQARAMVQASPFRVEQPDIFPQVQPRR